MRKRWIIPGLLAVAFFLAATGLANTGHGRGDSYKFGPYSVTSDDHGSCGNVWAADTMHRIFKVKRNRDGTFRLKRLDRGRFLTKAGKSPGACETLRPHGRTVFAGKHGRFHGFLVGTITGGTFDPKATCPSDCGLTDVFIATFFGPSATFSCFTDSPNCTFDYEYSAAHQSLRLHHWSDKGHGAGSMLHERFIWDIAGPNP